MKKLLNLFFLLIVLLSSKLLLGQELQQNSKKEEVKTDKQTSILTLDEATALALKNNELINIAENSAKIADLNTHIGQSELLPKVYLSGTATQSVSDSKTTFSSGQAEIANSSATGQTVNGLINLQYNLYNGGSKFYTKKYNVNQSFLKFWELKKQKESVIMEVNTFYLNVVKSTLLKQISLQSLKLSQDRYIKAERLYKSGAYDKVQLLNAEVAKNADSSAYINQQLIWHNHFRQLKRVMNVADMDFEVDTKVGIQQDLQISVLEDLLYKQNVDIKINEINKMQSQLGIKQEKSKYLPALDLNADYGYRNQTQTGSLISESNSLGFNASIRLNYTLFDGEKRRISKKQATIRLQNSELKEQYDMKKIIADLYNQFAIYQSKLSQLELETINQTKAKLNYDRSLTAFEVGQLQGVALREAQIALLQSGAQLVDILIDAKQAEVQLYLLSGQLLDKKEE